MSIDDKSDEVGNACTVCVSPSALACCCCWADEPMPSRTTQRPKETLKLKPQLKMMTLYCTVHYGTVRLWMHAVERFQPQHFIIIIVYCIIVISYQRIHQHVLQLCH